MAGRNVLLVIADQFRADCVGAAGNPLIQTPNLDALAADGVLFRNHFGQTSPCGPSRMCIWTGRYLCSHRSVNNMTPLVDAEDALPGILRSRGYRPALAGYNDYAVDPRTLPSDDIRTRSLNYDNFLPGFDVVLDHEYDSPEYYAMLREKGYPEEMLNRGAVYTPVAPPGAADGKLLCRYPAPYKAEDSECQFLTSAAVDHIEQQKEAGWVLSVNYIKPHPPHICSAPYHAMYRPEDMPAPARHSGELADRLPYFARLGIAPEFEDEAMLRDLQACYYGMVSEVDACLGRLWQALKDSGQWGNTLVIFTSDHGEYLGDHYLTGKGHFYDGAMHVPLIVRNPEGHRGAEVDGFTESIDLAPTVLDWLGEAAPDQFQGHSLLECTRRQGMDTGHAEIHYEYYFHPFLQADTAVRPEQCMAWVIRDAAYKYVQFGLEELPPLLFDLQEDPGELTNLAEDPQHAARALAYCQRLIRWRMANEDHRMERWAQQYR